MLKKKTFAKFLRIKNQLSKELSNKGAHATLSSWRVKSIWTLCAKTFGQSQSKKKRKCVAHGSFLVLSSFFNSHAPLPGTARIRAKNNRQKAWKTQTKSYSDVRQNYAHLCPRQLIEKLKDTMKMRLKSNYRNWSVIF